MQETSEMKRTKTIYWVTTILFLLPLIFSAFAYLAQLPFVIAGFKELGYPVYLIRMLGVAKLLGAGAILTGRFPRMKEWAYAGFTFDLIGAAISHMASGGPFNAGLVPLIIWAVMLVSYFQWKKLSSEQDVINVGHASPVNRAMGL
jgi:uncharacterized membrane protein YphA (DoxX/SURF4 family)